MATPKIKLASADGKIFTVDVEVAKLSCIVANMVAHCDEPKEGEEESPVHLEVTGHILEKVVQWCEHNYQRRDKTGRGSENEDKQLEEWNAKFLDGVENEVLLKIDSNYLDIDGLLDMCCKKVATKVKGKKPHEIRKLFGMSAGGKGEAGAGIN